MMRYVRLFRNISNWWLHFAVKFGLTSRDPLLFRTRKRIAIEVPRRLLPEFKDIFMEECYMRALGLSVPDGPTVIDIGANAGFFSLFAADRFPGANIYSYEPIDINFRQLVRNMNLNRECNIRCFKNAVFSHSGQLSLYYDTIDSLSTSATILDHQGPRDQTIQVSCVTLPEIFDENKLDRCDFMKLDCEGSEYEILYKCPESYLNRVSQIVAEVHEGREKDHNRDSLETFLKLKGFSTHKYLRHLLCAWKTR